MSFRSADFIALAYSLCGVIKGKFSFYAI